MKNNTWINLHFDTKHGPLFVYQMLKGNRRLIGERYGSYVVQFPSFISAKRAVEAYRKYVETLGYRHEGQWADCPVYVDHGNYEGVRHEKFESLRSLFFYRA